MGDAIVVGLECVGVAVFAVYLAEVVAHQQQPYFAAGARARFGQVDYLGFGGVEFVDVCGSDFGVAGTHSH